VRVTFYYIFLCCSFCGMRKRHGFFCFFLSLLLYYSAFFLLSARLNALTITQGWKTKTEGSDLGRRRFLQARGDNVLSLDKENIHLVCTNSHHAPRTGESENQEGGRQQYMFLRTRRRQREKYGERGKKKKTSTAHSPQLLLTDYCEGALPLLCV
jgi:hypothetical protein